MDPIRRQFFRFLIVFMIVLCVLCITLSMWTIRSAEKAYASQTYEQIYAIKRVFLKDTVHNTLDEIDRIRDQNRLHANTDIVRVKKSLSELWEKDRPHARTIAMALLKVTSESGSLDISFEDPVTMHTLFTTVTADRQPRFTETVQFGPYRLRLGVNNDWVDAEAKKSIANIIHNQKFQNGAYIWVNEIHDWNGGDNYAIRRIHPNLKNTEGSFLSTKTKDIQGNLPYLEELEGVRDHGEIYYSYYFKKLDSNVIAKKVTYATVYRDFNWIVAMGIYVDDIQTYIDAAHTKTSRLTVRVAALAGLLLAILFLAAFLILSRMGNWYIQKSGQNIRLESNTDPLTGALNRRIGNQYLGDAFKRFRHGGECPALFSFDLDNFKAVNDTYGHDAGDLVLKAVVLEIKKTMRSTDFLFRWGGEEFLLVCSSIDPVTAISLAKKINKEIASLPISLEGESLIHVSISIGISRFVASDSSPQDALKRADEAMYEAKASGKNCSRARFE